MEIQLASFTSILFMLNWIEFTTELKWVCLISCVIIECTLGINAECTVGIWELTFLEGKKSHDKYMLG